MVNVIGNNGSGGALANAILQRKMLEASGGGRRMDVNIGGQEDPQSTIALLGLLMQMRQQSDRDAMMQQQFTDSLDFQKKTAGDQFSILTQQLAKQPDHEQRIAETYAANAPARQANAFSKMDSDRQFSVMLSQLINQQGKDSLAAEIARAGKGTELAGKEAAPAIAARSDRLGQELENFTGLFSNAGSALTEINSLPPTGSFFESAFSVPRLTKEQEIADSAFGSIQSLLDNLDTTIKTGDPVQRLAAINVATEQLPALVSDLSQMTKSQFVEPGIFGSGRTLGIKEPSAVVGEKRLRQRDETLSRAKGLLDMVKSKQVQQERDALRQQIGTTPKFSAMQAREQELLQDVDARARMLSEQNLEVLRMMIQGANGTGYQQPEEIEVLP